MGLAISYGAPWSLELGDHLPEAWQVVVLPAGFFNNVLLHGFGRRRDAEIARDALEKLSIDWDAPELELRRQWEAFGGREAAMRVACEHLQW